MMAFVGRNLLVLVTLGSVVALPACDQSIDGSEPEALLDRDGGLLCPSECEAVGGDVNGDGQVDISDMVAIMNAYQYGSDHCELGADVNGDGQFDISDPVYLSAYLWQGGAPPVAAIAPGDVNGDGNRDIADLSQLPGYLFGGNPAEVCEMGADANGDCTVDISDVTTLTDWLYNGGPEPVSCPGA